MKTVILVLAFFATANAMQLRDISIAEAPACIQDLLAQIDVDSIINQVDADLEPFRTTGQLDIDALLGHVNTLERKIFKNQEVLDCLQDVIDQNELNEVIDSMNLSCVLDKIRQEDPHELVHYIDQFISLYREHGLEFQDIMEVVGAIKNFVLNETTLGDCF